MKSASTTPCLLSVVNQIDQVILTWRFHRRLPILITRQHYSAWWWGNPRAEWDNDRVVYPMSGQVISLYDQERESWVVMAGFCELTRSSDLFWKSSVSKNMLSARSNIHELWLITGSGDDRVLVTWVQKDLRRRVRGCFVACLFVE